MSDVSTADASSRYHDRGVGRFFYSGKKQAADIARWRGLSRPLYLFMTIINYCYLA